MQNTVLPNVLLASEIAELLANHDVITNKEKLESQNVVKFAIELPAAIKTKLEDVLAIDLSQISTIPMRWIKGDTLPHIDRGEAHFNRTYLVYLTDCAGSLIVDGIQYPIVAGDAHVFSEGLEHHTINTENDIRLLIGPISEMGFGVGGGITYYATESDAQNYVNSVGSNGSYTIQSINGISSWTIVSSSNSNTTPSPNGGPYNTGDTLIGGPQYYLCPYVLPVSNVCFPAKTPITTDQGIIAIEKLNPLKHTIRNKPIVAITQTVTSDKYLVCFEKDSIDKNIPCEKTVVSQNHLVFCGGKMIMAKCFIGKYENVHKQQYRNEILYNVLLETYDKMIVNNMICETLHPTNTIAKLYTLLPKYSLEQQLQLVKLYNHSIAQKKGVTIQRNILH